MSKKGHAPGPVPPGNRPHVGPAAPMPEADDGAGDTTINGGAGFNEQDPDRRLGNYQTAGEHSYVQPGGKNDADHQVGGERNPTGRSADK
jgi:hypothetical protein